LVDEIHALESAQPQDARIRIGAEYGKIYRVGHETQG
jgi:hypothetical protein